MPAPPTLFSIFPEFPIFPEHESRMPALANGVAGGPANGLEPAESSTAAPARVGIARLAAQSPLLAVKRSTTYQELPTRTFIGRSNSRRLSFDFTVNAYRGCEYACKYCYARYTHQFMDLPPEAFEQKIFAKRWNPAQFLRDLGQVKEGDAVAFGTATDCYQPAERRYGLMRKMLELLLHRRGLRIGITTKSDLFTRDADLLVALAQRHQVRVTSTVTTVDAALARQLEPLAPRPDLRLAALAQLAGTGVSLGVAASPVLPLLTDQPWQLEAVAKSAKAHGATYFHAHPVFLKDSALGVLLPWLEKTLPDVGRRYGQHFAGTSFVTEAYQRQLHARVERLRAQYGLLGRDDSYMPPRHPLGQNQEEGGVAAKGSAKPVLLTLFSP